MLEGEAEKGRSKWVSFGVVQCRQAGDEEGKVRGVVVLHAEVVHHQDEGDGTRGMTEKTGSGGLMEVKGCQERDKSEIGQLTGLFEAVHCFVDAKQDELFARFILLKESEEIEARQDLGEKRLVWILMNWGWARGDSR